MERTVDRRDRAKLQGQAGCLSYEERELLSGQDPRCNVLTNPYPPLLRICMSTQHETQLEWIFGRRSIRVYSPGEISEDKLMLLLKAAMSAPSAMTKDPWRFVVIRNQGTLARMPEVLPGGKMLATASLCIVVCGDLNAAFESHVSYLLQDCSAAVENLLLAAHTLGLGGCWVGVHPGEGSVRGLRTMLGLPKEIVPVAAIALGIPGEQLPSRTRFNPESVHYEKW